MAVAGHTKIYSLVHRNLSKKTRKKGDKTAEKIIQILTQIVTPLFKEFESGEYTLKLKRFVTPLEEEKIAKALSLLVGPPSSPLLSYAMETAPSQKIELVSLTPKSRYPERDLAMSLWQVIENEFGRDPWGSLYEEFMQKTSWPLIVKNMEEAIRKSFIVNPILAELLADNMRDALYYFLSFAARENIDGLIRLKPVIEIMHDFIPLGIKRPLYNDTWSILAG